MGTSEIPLNVVSLQKEHYFIPCRVQIHKKHITHLVKMLVFRLLSKKIFFLVFFSRTQRVPKAWLD